MNQGFRVQPATYFSARRYPLAENPKKENTYFTTQTPPPHFLESLAKVVIVPRLQACRTQHVHKWPFLKPWHPALRETAGATPFPLPGGGLGCRILNSKGSLSRHHQDMQVFQGMMGALLRKRGITQIYECRESDQWIGR